MFTKTDLAKVQNVRDEDPKWVNIGAQKNFPRYAARIGKEWNQAQNRFNEWHYRREVARAIMFSVIAKLVSTQPWYNGGYRAYIVAYALAIIGKCCEDVGKKLNFQAILEAQSLVSSLEIALAVAAKYVNDGISRSPEAISNISE